jgi:NADPH:quinone reductase-like Zn-dependent oxidoreductase
VLGYEVAGEVESVGEGVDSHSVGDRVMAGTTFGGQQGLVVVPASQAYPLPERLSFEQGTAFPVNYATAYAALVTMAGVKEGERVLVHAAAGGVGIAAIQIAKRHGAIVFGTASASKHDAIRAQGVEHAIDYRTQDFERRTRELTGDEGIDIALDALGPTSFRKDYRLLRDGGRLIMYGFSEVQEGTSRSIPRVISGMARMPFATFPWWKSAAVMNENKGVFGLNMLSWWKRDGLDRVIVPLIAALQAGAYEPVVAESFPFEFAGDAHRYLGERRNVGKVVLVPDG